MEPGGSIVHSQGLSSNPLSRINPIPDIYFFGINVNNSSNLHLGLPSDLFQYILTSKPTRRPLRWSRS